jgi:hypothetical protein
MGKRYGLSACYGCGVDAAPLELVKERLVVIGSHTGPSMITNQTVEDVN